MKLLSSSHFIAFDLSLPHSHTLVFNPFHDRYLNNNYITSIPSGAFTGLTALYTLWERGAVVTFCGSIVFISSIELHNFLWVCLRAACSSGVYSLDPLWINLMMVCFSLVFFPRDFSTLLSSWFFVLNERSIARVAIYWLFTLVSFSFVKSVWKFNFFYLLHSMNYLYLPLTSWSLILSMSDVSILMPSPASPAAPSPAWPRFSICEGGGLLYLCVDRLCSLVFFNLPHCVGVFALDLYALTALYFFVTRSQLILWCLRFSLIFFAWDRIKLPSLLSLFIICEHSLTY